MRVRLDLRLVRLRGDPRRDAAADAADRGRGGLEGAGARVPQARHQGPDRDPAGRRRARAEAGLRLALEGDGEPAPLEAEMLLVAVGRAPVTDGLGLEEVGVETDKGYVKVDERMRSTVRRRLRHRRRRPDAVAGARRLGRGHPGGRAHGRARAAAARLRPGPLGDLLRPRGRQRRPDRGGGARARPRRRGGQVPVLGPRPRRRSSARPTASSRSSARRRYDELLGVHIIGPHATELIAEACVALRVESTTEELFRTIHAHPTLSEAMAEAAHAAVGHAIHM